MSKNYKDKDFEKSAKVVAMYEMYMSGESVSDLSSIYKIDENNVRKLIKNYKNKYADESERDAKEGDSIVFKLKGFTFIGKVLKRYDYSVLVSFDENKFKGSIEDKVDILSYLGKVVVSDRDYRIKNRIEKNNKKGDEKI